MLAELPGSCEGQQSLAGVRVLQVPVKESTLLPCEAFPQKFHFGVLSLPTPEEVKACCEGRSLRTGTSRLRDENAAILLP